MTLAKVASGRTMFISGGSRGIGLAIAMKFAAQGGNVCLMAKTDVPDPRLEGTVHTAVERIESAGGKALGIVGDIRFEDSVDSAVRACVDRFGGIDVCVNNASAVAVAGTLELPMKRYDLMQDINTRGTYVVTRACLPHLLHGTNPHILTLSPPLGLSVKWYGAHLAYTMSKAGMSMCALGFAEEFRDQGVASNTLWPRTKVATAAIRNILGGEEAMRTSRHPEIMADAAQVILETDSRELTGEFLIDETVLRERAGVSDFSKYRADGITEDELSWGLLYDADDARALNETRRP
jgi:citronellol/citronellal dehydrogenase